jgi:hypothetical protein
MMGWMAPLRHLSAKMNKFVWDNVPLLIEYGPHFVFHPKELVGLTVHRHVADGIFDQMFLSNIKSNI